MAKTGLFGISSSAGGGGGSIVVTQATQTPSALDISAIANVTLATWKSFTFVIAQGTCLIDGVAFGVGTYSFGNGGGTLNAISYDASASTNTKLLIQL